MGKKLQTIIDEDREFLFQNNSRLPVCFERGNGAYLYDTDGKEYIDFFSGIAVSALGYAHPALSARLHAQVDAIMHSSNWYYNDRQVEAAKLISGLAFKGKTFFCNSGTEANEAAIKLARKWGKSEDEEKYHIVSFTKSFHGRTYGSLSATGQEKIRKGFEPWLPGFHYLPYGEIEPLKEFISHTKVCGIMLECIQGEGGINVAKKEFVAALSDLCKKNGILLIIDEIQTGIGRTGKAFGYQNYDITPDIITLAKGLGGGVPIGAIHAAAETAQHFTPGTHGTTFGGNQLACSAACAVLEELSKPAFMENVSCISKLFFDRLNAIKDKSSAIKEVRGIGLHI
ncbi:MAG: aspartate aminotransferase family protein, partial [Spirochaetota bacterium]